MRIYHIGPPKTGTTSFQNGLNNNPAFLGIKQPRSQRQNPTYRMLTDHLRRGLEIKPEFLPDHFIYSEEMILWNLHPGHIQKVLVRLAALLRAQDKVIISTRNLEEVLFSWFCERYEDFHPSDFRTAALNHPSFEAYNWQNLSTLISLVDKNQVEVIDFKDLLKGKSEVLSERKINLESTKNYNNKHKGKSIKVNLKNPTIVHLLKHADKAYCIAFPHKNNYQRISKSRLIEPHIPLKTFELKRPSDTDLKEVIQARFSNGLRYLKSEFGIDYHALQQP